MMFLRQSKIAFLFLGSSVGSFMRFLKLINMNKVSHIPHQNLFGWTVKSDSQHKIKGAQSDHAKRKFVFRFFLEDLRARTQFVHVLLAEELSQSAQDVDIWFEKNENGFLSVIQVELIADNFISGFRKSHDCALRLLSMITFFYRRPCRISFISAFDAKHELVLEKMFNTCPAPAKFILPKAAFSKEVPIGSLLAIYREAMNSIDLGWRYINFFKIYESWYKNRFVFDLTNKLLQKDDIERPEIIVTKDLLQGAFAPKFHKEILNRNFKDKELFKELNHIRNLIAHELLTRVPDVAPHFGNFDDTFQQESLEANSNLVERMATKILEVELDLLGKCDQAFKEVNEIYKDIC